ncbi:ketopantoate reductase C-terminal domain-containing protein [Shewanella aestuarii]|uniref:ketopantoate reductase C-terminal domain-containing protein n=1 Tax=Shewanella aestuarii TaxID=1028752 RepID=UPI001FCBA203|nr:ketopantoate reductase C-terminal domain-containing protein [Shewanella aestuarii]
MQEWLNVCQKAQFPVKQFTKLAPKWLPIILRLPNGLFNIIAKPMLAIDPQARSSMWEDIQAKRLTEIDYLNGAVVKLGQQYHVATPINQRIYSAIKLIEQGKAVDVHQLTSAHYTSSNKTIS